MSEQSSTDLAALAAAEGVEVEVDPGRRVVVVQGLGFVGSAMATACAAATGEDGRAAFTVVGVDVPDELGRARIDSVNAGSFPFETSDQEIGLAIAEARKRGNLVATADERAYSLADVVVVDVAFDIDWRAEQPKLLPGSFEKAIRVIGRNVRPGALVLVETTVPPGATEKIVVPALAEELQARGIDPGQVLVAHSFERVTPGSDCLSSVTDYWRVYAGSTEAAADAAEAFLRVVVNTDDYPLRRLATATASETAKVLENTFRATTIALMEEWSRFAEMTGIDLYEIVDVVRMRPTHANIRTPGFGVGGYCLTKDPLFASLAASSLWDEPVEFPFSSAAVRINDQSPLVTLGRVEELLGGDVSGRTLLLAGVSYRPDVADTRYSPSESFVRAAEARGATVLTNDPLVGHWHEMDREVPAELQSPAGVDAIVFAVPHSLYRGLDLATWLGGARPVIFDACGVLSAEQRTAAMELGCTVAGIGRGTEHR